MTNQIHPTAIIEDGVQLGSGNSIGAYVVIHKNTILGDGNWIGTGCVLGAHPEVRPDSKRSNQELTEGVGLIIGNKNVFREYSQVHQGWKKKTVIQDNCYIMNQVYIAHDCHISQGVVLASSVLLAGHVNIGKYANLGLGASVHQGINVGALAMVGMGSVVVSGIPSFAKAYGNPARTHGANIIGMRRNGFDDEKIRLAEKSFAGTVSTAMLQELENYLN